jgi:N6-L-threonylcarbamoyladenine synthase
VPWVGIMANHMRVATLGLDTSCYTTSAALVIGGILAYDGRAPLQVSKGHVGLRQSEALFQHVRNLPRLIEAACDGARRESCDIVAVAASAWPRRVEGSYMPVFLASAGYGRALAAALGVPFLETSHQEGHVAAARWSSGLKPDGGYLALHLSGGTTELLSVKSRFQLELLGATDDLNAGQFVDRVGVALGLSFPAGPDLERLAGGGEPGRVSLPVAVRGLRVSFSGPCSAAMREIDSGARPADIAYGVLECIGKSTGAICREGLRLTRAGDLLVTGGVASNALVRHIIAHEVGRAFPDASLHYAAPEHSRDNAVGCAVLAWRVHVEERQEVQDEVEEGKE